jgi:hypothetical protein
MNQGYAVNRSAPDGVERDMTTPATRAVVVLGLLGLAAVHMLDLSSTMAETPYAGWLYVGAIGASLSLAGMVLSRPSAGVVATAGALAGAVLGAYVLSRTVGLPGMADDVGRWGQPLGVASLLAEGAVLLAAALALTAAAAPSGARVAGTGRISRPGRPRPAAPGR